MEPIVATADSADNPVERSFRVDNPTGSPAAVEISVLLRHTTLDGKEVREPANDQFVVFPEQMVLMPGESQLVRVQWLGQGPVSVEHAYRVIAEELPVDFREAPTRTGSGPQLNLMMRYEGMLYIQPPTPEAKVSVVSANVITDGGSQLLELVLVNTGNSHVVMKEPEIHLNQRDGAYPLGVEAKQQLKVNMLAGEKRRFLLSLPLHIEADGLDVQFFYKRVD